MSYLISTLPQRDQVIIEGLRVDAVIGVYEWERNITQPVVIDAIIYTDHKQAAQTDDIDDAINYKKVCEEIRDCCQQCRANLIERLAEDIASMMLVDFDCDAVDVTVKKPTAINETENVAVRIFRQQDTKR